MMKRTAFIFPFLLYVVLLSVNIHAETLSWHHKNPSSLKVIAKDDVVSSNCAVMSTGDQGYLITEDQLIPEHKEFDKIFVRFTKNFMSSYVVLSLIDSYSDQEIQSWSFYENGSVKIQDLPFLSDRVYFKISIYGQDIELRTFGINLKASIIAEESDFSVLSDSIYADTDILAMNLNLQQESKVYLYLYNHLGTIVEKISDGKILNKGSYEYQWDPNSVDGCEEGQYYYVWAKLENLRSETVEFTKNIYVLPKYR